MRRSSGPLAVDLVSDLAHLRLDALVPLVMAPRVAGDIQVAGTAPAAGALDVVLTGVGL